MLVAHLSDIHLGYSQFNLEEREKDIYNAFEQAIDISIREGVRAVILAGDIFDSPKPPGRAIVKLGDQLKKLKEKNIRVFFVLGEHDVSRVRGVPVSWTFHNLGFATYLKNGEDLHEFNNTLFVGFDKYRRSEIEDLIVRLREVDQKAKEFSGHRVLILHEGLLDINKYAGEIGSNDLPQNFTYYAMGHYHDRSTHRFDHLGGPLVYPGSIEITPSEAVREAAGEAEKGFYIVDLSGKEASAQWQKLDIRPQISVSVKYDELAARLDELRESVQKMQRKPVLHLTVSGKEVDSRRVADLVSKLATIMLHSRWDVIDEPGGYTLLEEKPGDITTKLLELASKELGSEDESRFAVNDLLPPLERGEIDEALELAWQVYEKSKSKGGRSDA